MKDTEEIKQRLSIEEVVGQYVELERSGSNLKARCPFHNEKTASFFVSPERGSFYCFGCGEKGDIFSFVEKIEGIDFVGALQLLAERAGVVLTKQEGGKGKYEDLYDALERATVFFEERLKESKEAKRYLEGRGISEQTQKFFRIGYSPNEWHALEKYLRNSGVDEKTLILSGLTKPKQEGKKGEVYDVFRHRIMFPIFDTAGRTIAFSGRALQPTEKSPKYLNSPETEIFRKSEVLYGYHRARQAMRKYNFAILVEGQIDLVLSHQAGFPNTVASSGTSITRSHLALIKRMTDNLLIALDSDRAGISSGMKTAAIALSLGMDVKGVMLPEGKDPADVISHSLDEWKKIVRTSESIIEIYLEKLLVEEKDPRKRAKAVREKILPLLAHIPNAIDRAHFTSVVAEKTRIPRAALEEELVKSVVRGIQEEENRARGQSEPTKPLKTLDSLHLLLGIVVWQAKSKEKVIDITELEGKLKALHSRYNRVYESPLGDSMEGADAHAFEAERMYGNASSLTDSEIDALLKRVEKVFLEEHINRLKEDLEEAERSGDEDVTKKILQKLSELSEEMKKLHL